MENFLEHMISEVNQQRQTLEEECRVLKDLLKPWPIKNTASAAEDERYAQVTKMIKPDSEKQADALNAEEKQALLQVNELLQKAQKTLSIKTKQQEISTTNQDNDDGQSSVSTHEKVEFCNDSVADSKKKESCQKESVKENAKGSQSKVNRPTKSCASSGRREEKQSGGLSHGSAIQIKLSQYSVSASKGMDTNVQPGSHRPSSGHSTARPASGKNKHVPAHMTAPFKTNGNMKFPQRKTNDLSSSRTNPRGARSMSLSNKQMGHGTYRTLPAIKTGHVTNSNINKSELHYPEMSCDGASEQWAECVTTECKDVMTHSGRSCDSQVDVEKDANKKTEHSIKQTSTTFSKHNPSDSVGTCDTSECHMSANEIPQTASPQLEGLNEKRSLFTLKSSGSSLKVPVKLQKLLRVNNSLRERCSALHLIKKVSSGDAAQQFINRLMAQEEVGQELWMRVSALTCLRSHQILLDTLKSLNLSSLSENSSATDIYRAKRILEFVLSAFADLQESSDYLSKVQLRSLPSVEEILKAEAMDSRPVGEKADAILQDHLGSSSQWAHLKFTEKYLKTCLSLAEVAQLEWWKVIDAEKRDPQVLQAIYGILTTSGQFLPALVKSPDTYQP